MHGRMIDLMSDLAIIGYGKTWEDRFFFPCSYPKFESGAHGTWHVKSKIFPLLKPIFPRSSAAPPGSEITSIGTPSLKDSDYASVTAPEVLYSNTSSAAHTTA